MTRLLLVRHGESTANRDRLALGCSLDVPLTEAGRQQAAWAAERVTAMVSGPTAVLSSDALRAQQTAAPIAARLAVPLEVTQSLREQYLGDLEGRPVGELRAMPVPHGLHVTEVGWGGGESIAEVHVRMTRFLGELAGRVGLPRTVVLVGHGHGLCVLQAVLDGRTHRQTDWQRDLLGLGEVRALAWEPNPPGPSSS